MDSNGANMNVSLVIFPGLKIKLLFVEITSLGNEYDVFSTD